MTAAAPTAEALTSDEFFTPLKNYVIAATGLAYYRDRNAELAEHLLRRFGEWEIADCRTYLQLLRHQHDGERELDGLIEELTIGETHFFRHPELFQALEQTILPEAIERNRVRRRLRIWSAGSSIGAEAYSVSILLQHRFAEQIRDWEITVLGTDINRSYLSRAAQAKFEPWALRGTDADIKQRCFSHRNSHWELKPEFKRGVSFSYHNLAKHAYPSLLHNLVAFDVILCRNVMIYFSPPVIEQILSNMRNCLVDGGWLLVGHAEHNPDAFRDFNTVCFAGATAYRRVDGPAPTESGNVVQRALPPTPASPPRPDRTNAGSPRSATVVQRRFAQPLVPEPQPTPDPAAELADIRRLADQGAIETAAARCRRLIDLHKLNPACHFYQALILEQLGDHAECERALRRAIYLNRNFELAHYYLGLTLQRLARRSEAARTWHHTRRLLALDDPARVLDDFDGLTAADLDELARLQLEALES